MRRLLAAIRAFVDELRAEPFFDLDDGDRRVLTDTELAGLLVLHLEAVHGCDHTGPFRDAIGMAGPRGKAASR